ncbi:MAG: phosphotransferase, partial [Kiritimatiellae bacterium]|nr:phosphotransferase [Kiritimatiellia bacterium]
MTRKAIVLAAGYGTRLRPFTCVTPKPLLPVWGEPMLSRIVARLRAHGVEDIVVNCHYLHDQVEAWCGRNGCRASYEPQILGTGGVLNPLRGWIGDEPFYLVNGDIVLEGAEGLEPALEQDVRARRDGTIASCLVTEAGPRTIEVEPESGFVTNWKSDDAACPGTFTYCGFACLSPEILKYVSPEGPSSIVAAYEKAMADGRFVHAVSPADALWTDAGTIASYVDVNRAGDENAFGDFPQVKAARPAGAVEFLGARGSERVFFRCDGGVIVVYDDATRRENALYAGHARFLEAMDVPVPAVLADLPEMKTLVLEDAGAERTPALADAVRVVEALADFGAVDASRLELMPPLDAAAWKWERDLFAEHCLGARFMREMPAAVEAELVKVAAALDAEPRALVHRDFQSTNILWKNGNFRFIDFQGMRLGPAVYDLASFLYDPYVKMRPERERRALVRAYENRSGRTGLGTVVVLAAVERLVQCLGAYGRLASVGQGHFVKWVLPALQNLLSAADDAGLDAVGALAED